MAPRRSLPQRRIAELRARFDSHVRNAGLRPTKQRDRIVDVFLEHDDHVTLDDLLRHVKVIDPVIGYATVYRTMRLLIDCGIAHERHFEDSAFRYELAAEEHHDHLVCTSCRNILEFESPRVEELQAMIAARQGFTLRHHVHELYGLCSMCRLGDAQ